MSSKKSHLGNIRLMLRLTAHAGHQSVSIQRRLMLCWLCLLGSAAAGVLLIFSITGGFSNQARKASESLNLQLQNMQVQIEQHMESLEAQSITLSEQITRELNKIFTANGLEVRDLNDNPDLIAGMQQALFDPLNTTLQLSQCSGAYLILDATTNTKSDRADHSATGLYLRFANLSAKGTARQDVVLFRGISEIARAEQLELHNRWNLEFDKDRMPGYDYYMQMEVDSLAEACRWTDKFRLTDIWEDVITLCVPILDHNRKVCGLCGVELSALYCYLSFPAFYSPYGPMVTVLSQMQENQMILEQGMTGSLNGTFLSDARTLTVEPGRYFNTYQSGTDSYIGCHREISPRGSSGRPLTAAVLVPEGTYLSFCRRGQAVFISCALVLMGAMIGLSLYLSRRFAKPFVKTLQAIQSEEKPETEETGISELDELMDFVRSRSEKQSIPANSLPPNIEELFHTFAQRAKTITPAERVILKYYIEGYQITEIPELAFVSIHTVKKHNSNIYQKLGVSSRDELMLYIELFRRCDRLGELMDAPTEV